MHHRYVCVMCPIDNRDNCIIDPCGWPKLQITSFGIKINSEIHVVGLIYKSLTGVKFR